MHPSRAAPRSDQARQRGKATATQQQPEMLPGRSRGKERVALGAMPPELETAGPVGSRREIRAGEWKPAQVTVARGTSARATGGSAGTRSATCPSRLGSSLTDSGYPWHRAQSLLPARPAPLHGQHGARRSASRTLTPGPRFASTGRLGTFLVNQIILAW